MSGRERDKGQRRRFFRRAAGGGAAVAAVVLVGVAVSGSSHVASVHPFLPERTIDGSGTPAKGIDGAPRYGAPVTVDSSSEARGIAVDPFDDRLYVAQGDRVDVYGADGTLGIDELTVPTPAASTPRPCRACRPSDRSPTASRSTGICQGSRVIWSSV